MGGKSSPFKDIVKTIEKAASDTQKTAKGTPLELGVNTAVALGKAYKDVGAQVGRLDKVILSPTNATEEATKDAARDDARQREQAISDQKQAASDLTRQQASNTDASRGSNIILGKKSKKGKKGGSISSGLGLSKGKTGLQT